MSQYTVSQWILFFFWYCFVGWIWESLYVSVRRAVENKKWEWVNRGFMNGPILPIYGFASITILLATMEVREEPMKIYILGMLAVTAMELVTGAVMERLFGVKYWDYSSIPLNFHGYICFFVSLFWGVCALLVVKVIHTPTESIVLGWNRIATEVLAMVLVAIGVYDFSESFREAMDMKELLERLTESRSTIKKLERRFDAVVAFTAVPDPEDFFERYGTIRETVEHNLEKLRSSRLGKLRSLRELLHMPELEGERESLLEQIEQQVQQLFSRSDRQFHRAVRHLRRNPYTISKKYAEALKELKELFEERRNKEE